jgi:hypothetical protein
MNPYALLDSAFGIAKEGGNEEKSEFLPRSSAKYTNARTTVV